jgi:ABC-type transporter Mla maintaining outer membrane lipid asymmetry permease subunit MlaE
LFATTATLAVIAVVALITGVVLATSGYSSAGPVGVASACVGVIGTLVAQQWRDEHSQRGGTT